MNVSEGELGTGPGRKGRRRMSNNTWVNMSIPVYSLLWHPYTMQAANLFRIDLNISACHNLGQV